VQFLRLAPPDPATQKFMHGSGTETLRFYMIDGLAGKLEHRQAEPEVQGERASLLPLQHHLHGRRHGGSRGPGQQHK
jgi:hypothetical protein